MAEPPKVFISYSHDTSEHKQWVSELGAKLRYNGVDAILDQWDLGLGDDPTRFMETGVRDSDRVLVICTDSYVRKANAGEGGVGYERLIVTAQLVQDLGTNKFIPIIRQLSGEERIPTYLGARIHINFTDANQFDEKFDELLHELHQVPIMQKPPLGKNPFATLPSGQETPPSEGLDDQLDILEQVDSASDAYSVAVKIARVGDVLGWRQLMKRIKPSILSSLVQWRKDELDGNEPDFEMLFQVVDRAVSVISPLITVALVGVESGREQLRDQKSLLYDLQNVPDWNRAGYTIWVNMPDALGYVYHSLHGGVSLLTGQLDLALSLAREKISIPDTSMYLPLWKTSELKGYAESISGNRGGNCNKSWEYLSTAYDRWKWLDLAFGDELEYRTSLVAYYMALHIHELADIIASGNQESLSSDPNPFFDIPLTFVSEGREINQRAVSLLLRKPESLSMLWGVLDVTREQMEHYWKDWIRLSEIWLSRVYMGRFRSEVTHQHLFELI